MRSALIAFVLLCAGQLFGQEKLVVINVAGAKPGTYVFAIVIDAQGQPTLRQIPVIHSITGAPQPPPDDPPPVPLPDLSQKVITWAGLVSYPSVKPDALKLAASYDSVASECETGMLRSSSPTEIVIAAQLSNKAALGEAHTLWSPFSRALGEWLTTEAQAGRLTTPAQHAVYWRQIAAGLRKAGE